VSPVDALVKDLSDLRHLHLNQKRTHLSARSFAMTPAGVGKLQPDDSKTAVANHFTQTDFPDLLAN